MIQTYKLLPEAEKDLENIWLYTVSEWGIEQANSYVEKIDNAFRILVKNPYLAPEYVEFKPSVRIHHHKKHLIIYLIKQTHILIVRVLHESMDIGAKF